MNVFQKAASSQAWFTENLKECGYTTFTTFYSDLTIAEVISGKNGIADTIKRVLKSWMHDIKYITEFCMAVNWKSWEMDAQGNAELCEYYGIEYYKVRDAIIDHYNGNDDALNYFFETTD